MKCKILFLLFFITDLFASSLTIQSTTSTRDSGLYDYLLPLYPNIDKVKIKVVAVGTGQAILNSQKCDGDILIVHDRERENEFLKFYGESRHSLMYNDYVLIGPKNDPANLQKEQSIEDAFRKLYESGKFKFISRSDSSGTHAAEMEIWDRIKLRPEDYSGSWYLETGQSMGQSLNISVATSSYIFSDRSTWIRFKNKRNHIIIYEDNNVLKNYYGMILVSKKKCPDRHPYSENLYNWLKSNDVKTLITKYTIDGNEIFYIE